MIDESSEENLIVLDLLKQNGRTIHGRIGRTVFALILLCLISPSIGCRRVLHDVDERQVDVLLEEQECLLLCRCVLHEIGNLLLTD